MRALLTSSVVKEVAPAAEAKEEVIGVMEPEAMAEERASGTRRHESRIGRSMRGRNRGRKVLCKTLGNSRRR